MTAGLKVDDQQSMDRRLKKWHPADLNRETVFLPEGGEEIHTSAPSSYRREHSDSVFLTDTPFEWFSTREEEDWFVHLSYLRPHPPWVAPEPFNTLYEHQKVPPPVRATSLEEEGSQHPMLVLHEMKSKNDFFESSSESPVAQMSDQSFCSKGDLFWFDD